MHPASIHRYCITCLLLSLLVSFSAVQGRPSTSKATTFGHHSLEDNVRTSKPRPRRIQQRVQRVLPRHLLQGGRDVALTSMTHYTLAARANGLTYSQRYTRHLTNPEVVFTKLTVDMNKVVFQSSSNRRYLMIDRRGRIRTSEKLTYQNIFIQKRNRPGTSSFTSYVERSFRWHLSINRRGKVFRNRRRLPARKLRNKSASFHIRLL